MTLTGRRQSRTPKNTPKSKKSPKITKKSQNISKHLKQIKNKTKQRVFFIFVPPEGNFDIEARDGGGYHKSQKYPQKTKRTNILYILYYLYIDIFYVIYISISIYSPEIFLEQIPPRTIEQALDTVPKGVLERILEKRKKISPSRGGSQRLNIPNGWRVADNT